MKTHKREDALGTIHIIEVYILKRKLLTIKGEGDKNKILT